VTDALLLLRKRQGMLTYKYKIKAKQNWWQSYVSAIVASKKKKGSRDLLLLNVYQWIGTGFNPMTFWL